MRPRTAKLVLIVGAIGVGLVIAEGIWRLFLPPPGFSAHSELGTPGIVVPHPRRSYTPAPGFSGRMTTIEFDVAVRTDGLGCRIPEGDGAPASGGTRPDGIGGRMPGTPAAGVMSEASPPAFTILALGDSFTFGHGLEARLSWPEVLGRRLEKPDAGASGAVGGGGALRRPEGEAARLRIRIVNAGVSGYNMAQVRDLAEEIAPRVRPDLVVLGLFVNGAERMRNPYVLFEGDVVREAERRRLRAVPGGFLRTRMNRPWLQALDFTLQRRFYVGAASLEAAYRAFTWMSSAPRRVAARIHRDGASEEKTHGPTEAGERAYLAPMLEEVDGVGRLARSLGAPLVVLVIHVQREDGGFREIDGRFSKIVEEHCRAHRLPLFDPTPILRERAMGRPVFRYSRLDAHWSAAGHALVAEELARFLERERLVAVDGGLASSAALSGR